ncbi:hypothetical protein CRG98_007852 [Punica granatum]|uniref:Retrotransposon Copia-like N-terminal domain-containing protein n=1 Tax=Punica granatum TaxID=22663 RepID=A0A2I0KTC1_PUNGR|nr:hypothetical protein CRG98_007852 [Punica granatum]
MAGSSSSSTLTILPSSSSTSTTLPSSSPTIPVKLNGRNYLYWKGIMTPLLNAYELLNYVEGKVTVPSKTTTGADRTITLNSDYLNWQSMDNFALIFIKLAVTEEIGVTLLSAETSYLTAIVDQQWRDLKKGDQSNAKFNDPSLSYPTSGGPVNSHHFSPLHRSFPPLERRIAQQPSLLSTELAPTRTSGEHTMADDSHSRVMSEVNADPDAKPSGAGDDHDSPNPKRQRRTVKAQCKHCEEIVSASIASDDEKARSVESKQSDAGTVFQTSGDVINQYDFRKALAVWLVCQGLPYETVEQQGFRHLMGTVCPNFNNLKRERAEREVLSRYFEERDFVKSELRRAPGRISLSVGIWKSGFSSDEFICITARGIDDSWKLQRISSSRL